MMKDFLVLQLARFGDLVQTKRLIKSLQTRGRVHLCIDTSLKDLAYLLYPDVIVHPICAHHGKYGEQSFNAHIYKSIQSLTSVDFCAVYNLNHTAMTRALVRLFPPEKVCGYRMEGGQLLVSPWIQKAFRWTRHRMTSPLNLVDFWAYFDPLPCVPQQVNPVAKGQGRGIGVVLAGQESRRSLPPTLLAQILRIYFEAHGGAPVYLLGSTAEEAVSRKVLRLLPPSVQGHTQNLCGKTSWADLFDAVTGLDALVTPDTGTMHLAAHLGVPVHAFFLSSAWCHETGSYGEGHKVWQSTYACAPCLESKPCTIDTKCLEPFSSTDFLRTLTAHIKGNMTLANQSLPEYVTLQSSHLDCLGSTWQTELGHDDFATQRQGLRTVVADYCHSPLHNECFLDERIQTFYEEKDWMLEKTSVPMGVLVPHEV